jgi:hypothetical protein
MRLDAATDLVDAARGIVGTQCFAQRTGEDTVGVVAIGGVAEFSAGATEQKGDARGVRCCIRARRRRRLVDQRRQRMTGTAGIDDEDHRIGAAFGCPRQLVEPGVVEQALRGIGVGGVVILREQ